ncbi:Fur family transcriptional regulator [Acinetobacter qingfengensis]|uniref:Fur family transcriptional regulator n=1 Tax=Acinetobacter qingfengensis TaxID=1262585 RepID=A0A1E7R7N3_9GAMM|nr:transcriptional repressor [Acinetobacter qingfengensis]KAA8731462.1 Fur family transcriptional regulator [Acinetobacter qingfengensis]OEY95311.1 Fur family transcriptional regulator [Acinetobacter qingfengensis]
MATKQLNYAQQIVLQILQNENKAISAYYLLNQAKPFGFHAPMQIYRILNKLMDYGLVVKLDSLNMYLAHECQHQHAYQLLTICTECQKVQCVDLPQLGQVIQQFIHPQHFNCKHQHLELLGQCALCCSQHKD